MAYTQEQLKEFRRLVELSESRNQMDRIHSRLEMPAFIQATSREVCDEMFEALKQELNNGKA